MLKLYFHPLASFCWKVLIPLYENDTPFAPEIVDLADPVSRANFEAVWPMARFPVLVDPERHQVVPESSTIIEYLQLFYPGPVRLVPADPDRARIARQHDRFYDSYVMDPMQKIVTDRIRPAGANDPHGVAQARALLHTSYAVLERTLRTQRFAAGDEFGLADCAAAPSLYYANRVQPFGAEHGHVAAYFARLLERPSFQRVLAEAEPYFVNFPE